MAIDRRTQDADVMERVLASDAAGSGDDVRTEVVNLADQPYSLGWPSPRFS
ncbi:MAG TPA: hypothetical protein VMO26_13175 [Vicinamibacterales bacterium]|nr:hypothetical protein [Vicinamibacterales bacterium]